MQSQVGVCDNEECRHTSEHHESYENPVCNECSCSWYVNKADRYATKADGARLSAKYIQITEGR